ncbi:hypothetical protein E2C01_014307 [Portunus trituberculatus]|uniref:Uncharacterized protein n=1 Tax=Portunus trituberculatus TaxID=210409 RepID=A0A5B7DJJ0_PORTR|nr:hypothetical protein [Portunus trituberculatus]
MTSCTFHILHNTHQILLSSFTGSLDFSKNSLATLPDRRAVRSGCMERNCSVPAMLSGQREATTLWPVKSSKLPLAELQRRVFWLASFQKDDSRIG